MAMFFADSRLWLGANGWRLWWKRVALDDNKERFVQIERLLAQKRQAFENSKEGLVQMESFWFLE